MEKSVADEIAQVSMKKPHVILLGAGASRATFPEGDRNGRLLPLMVDFVEIVPIKDLLTHAGIPFEGRNFEEIYSDLFKDGNKAAIRKSLEKVVFDYFSSLSLPETPTLYDYLVLSLRPKDFIATFNWDPFLIQAAMRNASFAGCPKLLFLHGNVLQGYCEKDNLNGLIGSNCPRCGDQLKPTRLLYPISNKDYESEPSIRSAWEALKWAFKHAFMVTIFGYSAPKSDLGAVKLLQDAWGSSEQREFEQFEIIDIRDEEVLLDSWQGFIHTHHYEIHKDFFDSWISKHPRRTGEAYWNQYLEAAFIEDNPLPKSCSLEDLWQWYKPLIDAERASK